MPPLYDQKPAPPSGISYNRRGMRAACVVVLLCVFAGCKGKGEADAAPDPAALKAQQELVARRDSLLAARQKLQSDRQQVDEQIKQAEAKGGDTSELIKKRN